MSYPTPEEIAAWQALSKTLRSAQDAVDILDRELLMLTLDDDSAHSDRTRSTAEEMLHKVEALRERLSWLTSPIVNRWTGGGRDGPGTGASFDWRDPL